MKIVIAAASGNIGRRTAEKVIQAGAETVLLARNPEKLADLVAKGAIVHPISSDDAQGLIEVTQQADALFWLTPPQLDVPNLRDWYLQTATAIAIAAIALDGYSHTPNGKKPDVAPRPLELDEIPGVVEHDACRSRSDISH